MAVFIKNILTSRERRYALLDTSSRYDESSATEAFLSNPDTPGCASTSNHDCTANVAEKNDAPQPPAADNGDTAPVASTTEGAANFRAHLISNFTIGFSDGLTVPFAVTAGLSTLGKPRVVIFGGLSELVAGTISMGMGGYLGAKGEVDAYIATLSSARQTVLSTPEMASSQISRTLGAAHIPSSLHEAAISHLLSNRELAIDFLMRFHHQLPASAFPRHYAVLSGLVISLGYLSGGIVPLLPYLFTSTIDAAFTVSIVITACVLLGFGAGKTWLVGEADRWTCARGGFEMLVLGGTAAGAAVGCVKAFS